MIETIKGNVLDINVGIIVHSCNNQGVMGSGIAKEVRTRFPSAYATYMNEYNNVRAYLGSISSVEVAPFKLIVNGIGQNGYGRDGKRYVSYDALTAIFQRVNKLANKIAVEQMRVLPICFPMIGAGLGGGDWDIIKTIIDKTISDKFEKKLYIL